MQGNLIVAGVCVLRGRGTIKTDEYGNERKRTENGCAAGYPMGLRSAVGSGSGEELPQGKPNKKNPAARLVRVSRRAPRVIGGFLRGRSHLGRGSNVAPLLGFFLPSFFSPGKKSGKAGAGEGFDDNDTVAAFI